MMAFITEIESHESKEHIEAKFKLFKLLFNNKITLTNQFGNKIYITPSNTWMNLYIEAYIYKDDKNNDPFKGSSCQDCYHKTDEFVSRINKNNNDIYEESNNYCFNNRFNNVHH
jgi:hypothetical protein